METSDSDSEATINPPKILGAIAPSTSIQQTTTTTSQSNPKPPDSDDDDDKPATVQAFLSRISGQPEPPKNSTTLQNPTTLHSQHHGGKESEEEEKVQTKFLTSKEQPKILVKNDEIGKPASIDKASVQLIKANSTSSISTTPAPTTGPLHPVPATPQMVKIPLSTPTKKPIENSSQPGENIQKHLTATPPDPNTRSTTVHHRLEERLRNKTTITNNNSNTTAPQSSLSTPTPTNSSSKNPSTPSPLTKSFVAPTDSIQESSPPNPKPRNQIPEEKSTNFSFLPPKFFDTFKQALLSRIDKASLKEISTKDWNEIATTIKTESVKSLTIIGPSKTNDRQQVSLKLDNISDHFSQIWTFLLREFVHPTEKKLDSQTFFYSKDEFVKIMKNFEEEAARKIPTLIPNSSVDKIDQVVGKKLKDFTHQFLILNQDIQKLEDETLSTVLAHLKDYYNGEMEFLLKDEWCHPEVIQQNHDLVCQETIEIFDESCPIKDASYLTGQKKKLNLILHECHSTFLRKNEVQKFDLPTKIRAISDRVKNEYKKALADLKYSDGITSQKFNQAERALRKNILESFDKETMPYPKDLVGPIKEKLVDFMDTAANGKRSELIVQETKERTTVGTREPQSGAKQHQQFDGLSNSQWEYKEKPKVNSTTGTKFQPIPTPRGPVPPPANKNDHQIPWSELIPLETGSVAFHVTLNRTKMGIVDNSGQIQILADVDNCLYLESSKIVPETTEEIKSMGKATPFHKILFENPLSKEYPISIRGKTYNFRVEELISFMLASLKWRAEFRLWKHIRKCLIVIPQCLNGNQRKAVQDAAELAGFIEIDLITDTAAMAVAGLMDCGFKDCQFVTINNREGLIDVATFSAMWDGSMKCDAFTGDVFVKVDDRSILESTINFFSFGHLNKDSSRRVQKIFEFSELSIRHEVFCVLSSKNDLHGKAVGHLKDVASMIKSVDGNYGLMGAGYLLAIESTDPSHRIYQKFWNERYSNTNSVESFKRKIVVASPRNGKGPFDLNRDLPLPLSSDPQEFQRRNGQYVLRSWRESQVEKLRWLQVAHNFHTLLNEGRVGQPLAQALREQLGTQWSKIKELKLSGEELKFILEAQAGLYSLYSQFTNPK